ncbi:16S rRNA (uracil(1498)-N(3))-methyltransferase [Amnibacterium sp.]|uniref:16S rRNA (uracil(1498)-N(3))-methyltransferase n=1 Tax=Amnibacterium sp. TaxID=1872496 RepID=UPI00261AD48B|nr:16S rRNA (uracil(1498)-N(3))-methyltransferase [Amnibacterium sp.]MCU1474352.1 rRNA ((1498)-N(3))-methyltransferase [Amnibacterium sp.]
MAHFYLSDQVTGAEVGDRLVLAGDEGRHAALVARMRAGERTTVGDGSGRVASAVATVVSKDTVELEVVDLVETAEPRPRITLVQALAKGGRDELAVQAATELGVAAVAPWQAARSVTRWEGRKAETGSARWAGIVREASKQAMRPWAAAGLPLMSTAEVVALAARVPMVVLDPDADLRLVDAVPTATEELVLVVGPEGGIAPEELERLTAAGATAARMGPTVLRTSTAGPAALAALAIVLDLWP